MFSNQKMLCRRSLVNNEYAISVFLHLSEPFTNHKILLSKFLKPGCRRNVIIWLSMYLSNRKQQVYLNNVESNMISIKYGNLQGSILGPLLFNIYMNDTAYISTHTILLLFADDKNLYISDRSISYLIEQLNYDLQICLNGSKHRIYHYI